MNPPVEQYVKKGIIKDVSSRQSTIPDYAMANLTEEGEKLLQQCK
jgi:hypothetical protein